MLEFYSVWSRNTGQCIVTFRYMYFREIFLEMYMSVRVWSMLELGKKLEEI
jgi:hypothetical protein